MHNIILWLKAYISIFGKIFSYVLPAIFSVSIYSIISFLLSPDYRLFLAILITVPLVFMYIELNKIFLEYSILTDTIVDILKKNMEKHSEGLESRDARVFPGKPMVNLKNYINAITSVRTNGYIEFSNCQNTRLELKKGESLMLYTVTPGMFKYFMILSTSEDHSKAGYIRIYPPNDMDVDARDFTETWFNHIIPILGNLSNSVSEKMDGIYSSYESPGYYLIRKYRIIKKGKKGLISFRILF